MPGLDQKLFFLINRQWTSPGLDRVMVALSDYNFWIPFICVFIVAAAWFGGFKVRAFLVTALLSVAFCETVFVGPIKKLVGRPRPNEAVESRTLKFKKAFPHFMAITKPLRVKVAEPKERRLSGGRSFPSGHTANNFAVAMVVALFFRRWGWVYFFVAAGISYSRIYTASHWPTDVFFSMFIGAAAGGITVLWASGFWRRRGPIWVPALYQRYPNLLNSLPSEANLSQSYDSPK